MIGPDVVIACPLCDRTLVTAARDSEVEFRDLMEGIAAVDWPYHECAVVECPLCNGVFRWADQPRQAGSFGDGFARDRYPDAVVVGAPRPEAVRRAVDQELWRETAQEWVLRLSAWLLSKPSYRADGRVALAAPGAYRDNLDRLSALAEQTFDVWEVPVRLVPLIGTCIQLELGDPAGALGRLAHSVDLRRVPTESGGGPALTVGGRWYLEAVDEMVSLVRHHEAG